MLEPNRELNENIILFAQNFSPTQSQISLLDKGLSFIPSAKTCRKQKETLRQEAQEFHRKLKLAVFFEGSENTEITPFIPKSNWEPRDIQIPDTITWIIGDNHALIKALNPQTHKGHEQPQQRREPSPAYSGKK